MSDYFRQHAITSSDFTAEKSWSILSVTETSIKQKIENIGLPLSKWDVRINRGILTGFNEAFIINESIKNDLVAKSSKNAEIIRPILLGKNIKQYQFSWDNLWIIFTRRGVDIEQYPFIKEYLHQYFNQLKPRNNNEATGRKPGSYNWYEIQDNVAYYQDFEKEKIVWGNLSLKPQFSMVDRGYYINAPSAFIATDNKFVLAVLNSKITEFYMRTLGVERSGGYLEYKPMFVEQIPIPILSEEEQRPIIELVYQILERKKNNIVTLSLETELNNMIYILYGLTKTDVDYLDSI